MNLTKLACKLGIHEWRLVGSFKEWWAERQCQHCGKTQWQDAYGTTGEWVTVDSRPDIG